MSSFIARSYNRIDGIILVLIDPHACFDSLRESGNDILVSVVFNCYEISPIFF